MWNNLKAAIGAKGYTQRSVAMEVGMSEGRLSNIICGVVDPRWSEILKLGRVLDCSPTELVDDADTRSGGRGDE